VVCDMKVGKNWGRMEKLEKNSHGLHRLN